MFVTTGHILVSRDNKQSDRLIKEAELFHLRNLIYIGAC